MFIYSDEAKAIKNDIAEAREAAKKASRYLDQALNPATRQKWSDAYEAAHARIEKGLAALHEGRLGEVREFDDEKLVKRYYGAVDDLYEATMGDYSSSSINHAQEELNVVKEVLEERQMSSEFLRNADKELPLEELVLRAKLVWLDLKLEPLQSARLEIAQKLAEVTA